MICIKCCNNQVSFCGPSPWLEINNEPKNCCLLFSSSSFQRPPAPKKVRGGSSSDRDAESGSPSESEPTPSDSDSGKNSDQVLPRTRTASEVFDPRLNTFVNRISRQRRNLEGEGQRKPEGEGRRRWSISFVTIHFAAFQGFFFFKSLRLL